MRANVQKRYKGIAWWGWAAAAALYVGVTAAAVEFAWDRAIDGLEETGAHRLDLYAASLKSELGRYEMMPVLIARQDSVRALLKATPHDAPGLLHTVNTYLEAVNRDAGSGAADVIDLQGSVIAASNWNQPVSFVGTNVSYRPYFKDALAHGSGRFFGIGTNTGIPGLYFASAVRDDGATLGAAAVKVSVDALESAWRAPGVAAMVVDRNGVIVISTEPEWKFAALRPITAQQQSDIQASRQYAGRTVEALPYRRTDERNAAAWLGVFPDLRHAGRTARYLVMSRPAPQAGDSLMVLLDVSGARRQQQMAFAFVTGVFLIAALYAAYAIQRRRTIAARLNAQDALRRANDQLELTVAQRTAALTAANERMQQEIVERERTEQRLRDSQQEVVHAGKLAVLGQMAAGLTHELNQPLVAIRTLCDNARTFFERSQPAQALANLERIGKLVDSMAVLTGELKTFARKPDIERVAVSLAEAVAHARLIYDARIRDEGVTLDVRIPPGTTVYAESSQLQQVIVNLLGNALDAVHDAARREIVIAAHGPDAHGRVRFTIADSGAGIAPDVLAHLFEPFVTTKPRGQGLGLGLAITSRIVEGFGAKIGAANRDEGGAQFSIEFAAATPQRTDHGR
ncbi:sensor histidine kinase [Burkholderia stagnalis]|uniref:C4-dicarboxylate transport sensor protein DctB n=1 Tax=Burkholderia stagnalis TaxID=1503054 RepID=A0A104FRT5_9BURK|nr:ATP-binding protein [Burkholderia stagnalis]KVL91183.1 histidine kinase [Burkholderia stagnalis]KVL95097.1 histidine kinase [Burkholderia stagnalis]KVM15129.1 histidine kinase [Burkholderia stagnalis]KVX62256.1 histidine kinase [Burkholderia stagnalis]KVZ12077.1 histidine kinase [Burkholderia stagnalis]